MKLIETIKTTTENAQPIYDAVDKLTHGGTRPGAGRPKKEPTVTLAFRVPAAKADQLKLKIKALIKAT